MGFFFTVIILAMFLTVNCVSAEEKIPSDSSMETKLPEPPTTILIQLGSLDESIKQVNQDGKNKILAAKTELIAGKKVHVIKILTAAGHIQHIKIDASTGKTLEKDSK